MGFVDIHCHLLPDIDDGAQSLDEALAMARQFVEQGVDTVICTPHQLGNYRHNRGDDIRQRVTELQQALHSAELPLTILPGGDVRIEPDMVKLIGLGEVVSLGDHRRHVLLELPHEVYVPLDNLLAELAASGLVGILSHPERNAGLLRDRTPIAPLVAAGCLMQVTAGSLLGDFGPSSRELSEWMAREGLIHFLASDAHGPKKRRPRLLEAHAVAVELAGLAAADAWCCQNPAAVAKGNSVEVVPPPRSQGPTAKRRFWPWSGR